MAEIFYVVDTVDSSAFVLLEETLRASSMSLCLKHENQIQMTSRALDPGSTMPNYIICNHSTMIATFAAAAV